MTPLRLSPPDGCTEGEEPAGPQRWGFMQPGARAGLELATPRPSRPSAACSRATHLKQEITVFKNQYNLSPRGRFHLVNLWMCNLEETCSQIKRWIGDITPACVWFKKRILLCLSIGKKKEYSRLYLKAGGVDMNNSWLQQWNIGPSDTTLILRGSYHLGGFDRRRSKVNENTLLLDIIH